MIIFGTRRYLIQLAMITLVCGRCGNTVAHSLKKRVLKFTLFFIPLIPVNTKYLTQCTSCGLQQQVSKERAAQLQTAPPAGAEQGMPLN